MSFWTLVIGILLGVGGAMAAHPARAGAVAWRPVCRRICCPIPPSSGSAGRTAPPASGSRRWSSRDGEPHAERVVDAERLSVAQIVAVDRRLERARDQEQSGAERMEGGTLVFHAAAGVAVGLLLPGGPDAARLEAAESDLRRLADGVRRRPQIVQLAQASTQEASLESVGSVGLRLAYQLERMLDAQVVVAAFESGY